MTLRKFFSNIYRQKILNLIKMSVVLQAAPQTRQEFSLILLARDSAREDIQCWEGWDTLCNRIYHCQLVQCVLFNFQIFHTVSQYALFNCYMWCYKISNIIHFFNKIFQCILFLYFAKLSPSPSWSWVDIFSGKTKLKHLCRKLSKLI